MSPRLGFGISLAFIGAIVVACGEEGSTFAPPPPPPEEIDAGPQPQFPPHEGPPGCVGLECKQVKCEQGLETTVTGTIMAPNGTLPLYNVIVYVPNAEVEPLAEGLTCDQCGKVSGKPLVSTLSGTDGKFVLRNVPVGEDIPLVIQVGKWRRQVKLPSVTACAENAVTDVNLTRLPKNQAEGDLPRIAVTTGRCDQLACLLPKLGLDASEFTPNTGTGRLHLYRGASHSSVAAPAPRGTPDATTLWASKESLSRYDMVLLSCECGEKNDQKPAAAKQAMYQYTTAGGRVFASHFHYTWADSGPLASTADWQGDVSNPEDDKIEGPFRIDRSFAKGEALAQWLVTVEASTTLGEMPINEVRENVFAVSAPTQRWVYADPQEPIAGRPNRPESTKYLSANSPVDKPVEEQCGKFVYADMHLYSADIQPNDGTALPNDQFPTSCPPDLTPEEKAFAFLFFDLSSCIQDDRKPPSAPR